MKEFTQKQWSLQKETSPRRLTADHHTHRCRIPRPVIVRRAQAHDSIVASAHSLGSQPSAGQF